MLRVVVVFAVASFVAAFLLPAVVWWFVLAFVVVAAVAVLQWLVSHAFEWEGADDD